MNQDELLNFRKVSEYLTGGPFRIKSTYVPKKQREKINKLRSLVKEWMEENNSTPKRVF
jgi:hypothetical protein